MKKKTGHSKLGTIRKIKKKNIGHYKEKVIKGRQRLQIKSRPSVIDSWPSKAAILSILEEDHYSSGPTKNDFPALLLLIKVCDVLRDSWTSYLVDHNVRNYESSL